MHSKLTLRTGYRSVALFVIYSVSANSQAQDVAFAGRGVSVSFQNAGSYTSGPYTVARGVSLSFANASSSTGRGVSVGFGQVVSGGSIFVSTDLASASFSIAGPVNYNGVGTSFTLTTALPGTYTITFSPVAGYPTPLSQTQTLQLNGTITFTAFYGQQVSTPGTNGSIDLLDATTLLSNGQITSDPGTLATQGVSRLGVAADGAAKLVIRLNASASGAVLFSLVDQSGQPIFGTEVNGKLSDLHGIPIDGSTVIQTTTAGTNTKAFAVYTAPSDYVPSSSTDDVSIQRQVFLCARFSSGGLYTPCQLTPILIVRPLILLVHGIWSDETAWKDFAPFISQPQFRSRYAVYPSSNGFATNAAFVLGELKSYLGTYKKEKNIATVQADVVTHSMGADVVRRAALMPTFINDPLFPTFGFGPIHRLITIAGVHLGTRFATMLAADDCVKLYFTQVLQRPTDLGAVDDLAVGSAQLQLLNSATTPQTPFQVHKIVGLANQSEKDSNNLAAKGLIPVLKLVCPDTQFTDLDSVLQSPDSDLLVTAVSQEANVTQAYKTFLGVVHSDPFAGTSELTSFDIATWVMILFSEQQFNNSNFKTLP